jgi:acyl transferase domain-containing protein
MLAPDGRCKTLDAAADGYVRAEAVSVMVIEVVGGFASSPASPAPLAVLAGSAVNQDGRSSGLTAPNGPAQQEVISQALAAAGLSAADVCGVSTHGTGTSLGDPIEVGALAAVFGGEDGKSGSSSNCTSTHPLALMSSKSWLGHAEPAAGVVGMLHTQLALQQRAALPVSHLRTLNPYLDPILSEARGVSGAGPGKGRGWLLPRDTHGHPLPSAAVAEASVIGTSAFAYQVQILGGFYT